MRSILSSLAEFIRAGLRPRTPLAKAITLALAIKLVAVVSMKVFWFSGEHRPVVDEAVMERLIGPPLSSPSAPRAGATILKATESLEATRRPGG